MKMKKKFLMFSTLLLALVVFVWCDAKDSCLDQGGTYDETTKTCDTAN